MDTFNFSSSSLIKILGLSLIAVVVLPLGIKAEEIASSQTYEAFMKTPEAVMFTVNNLWILIAAALVLLMHLGFATLESGLTRSKNTVNILFKNVFIISIGILTYAFVGFNSMYPGGDWMIEGWVAIKKSIGFEEAAMAANLTSAYSPGYTYWTDFIFQAMFAATAATIVSGAVAERVKLHSFLIFATFLVALAYPIAGSWKWGGGWLEQKGFVDFAGSSIVHAFGGFAALGCVLVLGPRKGKYVDGKVRPILGHSMPLATIGVFLLFIGWFGFNGGSVLSADPAAVSYVFTTTALAAAAGAVAASLVSWVMLRKPDLSMALNGILAGLVGITAGADVIGISDATLVGAIAGAIVVVSILILDKMQIDDPVGAVSVHGICGIWGTVAVALFSDAASLSTQLCGTLSYAAFAFLVALIGFGLLKYLLGVRVSEEEEMEGLDIGEHGQEAYPDFQTQIH